MRNQNLQSMILVALFAALISVASFIAIPIPFSAVPVTMQTFMIMVIGLLFKPKEAGLSVLLYLIIGALGLPVFAGGTGGFGVLAGPTGGFLISFVFAAIVISVLKGKEVSIPRMAIATAVGGMLVVYAIGTPWLAFVLGLDMQTAMGAAMLPFLVGDVAKVILAVLVSYPLRKQLKQLNYID